MGVLPIIPWYFCTTGLGMVIKWDETLFSNQMILICFRLWPHFVLLFIFLVGFVLRDYINASVSLLQNSTSWVVSYADVICIYDINYQLLMRGDARWYSLFDKTKVVAQTSPCVWLFYYFIPGSCTSCSANGDNGFPSECTLYPWIRRGAFPLRGIIWWQHPSQHNLGERQCINQHGHEPTDHHQLIIDLIGLSTNDIETIYTGEYMCIASDGYTNAKAKATFKHGKLLWNWFPCRILW